MRFMTTNRYPLVGKRLNRRRSLLSLGFNRAVGSNQK